MWPVFLEFTLINKEEKKFHLHYASSKTLSKASQTWREVYPLGISQRSPIRRICILDSLHLFSLHIYSFTIVLSAKVANCLVCRIQSVIVKLLINLSFSVCLCSVTFGPHTAWLCQPSENCTCSGGHFSRRGRHPDKERVKCDLTAPTSMAVSWYLSSSFSGNFQQRQTPSVWAGFRPSTSPFSPKYTHSLNKILAKCRFLLEHQWTLQSEPTPVKNWKPTAPVLRITLEMTKVNPSKWPRC